MARPIWLVDSSMSSLASPTRWRCLPTTILNVCYGCLMGVLLTLRVIISPENQQVSIMVEETQFIRKEKGKEWYTTIVLFQCMFVRCTDRFNDHENLSYLWRRKGSMKRLQKQKINRNSIHVIARFLYSCLAPKILDC